MDWAKQQGIYLEYTQPGQPQQNAYIERYNRTVRYAWLSQYLFETIVKLGILLLDGCGLTTMKDLIWRWVVLHQCRN
jgi:hypothetical protein